MLDRNVYCVHGVHLNHTMSAPLTVAGVNHYQFTRKLSNAKTIRFQIHLGNRGPTKRENILVRNHKTCINTSEQIQFIGQN